MAYKSVSALAEYTSSPGSVTVQSGVTTGDVGLVVTVGATNATDETPITATPSKAGLTMTRVVTTPDFPETDTNMWSDVFTVSGLTSADVAGTISVALSAARSTASQLVVFDSATVFGTPGPLAERTDSGDTLVVPSMACVPGTKIILIALDRSPAGTGYDSVTNSLGHTVTVHNYSEAGATGANCSIMVASFTATGTTTGDTTIDWSHSATNAQAFYIPGNAPVLIVAPAGPARAGGVGPTVIVETNITGTSQPARAAGGISTVITGNPPVVDINADGTIDPPNLYGSIDDPIFTGTIDPANYYGTIDP